MEVKMILVHALTSLHAGTGQGVSGIDMPIARERATHLPFVPGSTLKGCLRGDFGDDEEVFGKIDQAGKVQFSDARLLLMPLRCLGASFVWTTSPYVLRRFKRDLDIAELGKDVPPIPDVGDGKALVSKNDSVSKIAGKDSLVLEELDFAAAPGADRWSKYIGELLYTSDEGWRKEFDSRFAIIDDKSFNHLVKFGTEVNAHVRIDQKTGVADQGGLWYQESLPAESVLVSLTRTESPLLKSKADALWGERSIQIGGKASTGHGLVRFIPAGGTK